MPIYEYRCDDCGFEKDALQKMSDPPLVDCPQCGKPALRKLVSAAGFQLKGSGWYATDFRNSGAKPAPKGDDAKADTKSGGSATAPLSEAGSGDSKSGDSKSSDSKSSDSKSSDSKSSDSSSSTKSESTSSGSTKPSTPSTGTSS